MVAKCPSSNTASVEQDRFWDGDWDAHKVGWLISGAAAAVTCGIALITILGHARNYNRPKEQRQIIRVLLFPCVYAVVSFFSYRFFRSYTYYELAESAYEAFAIAAFLMLMLQYIGNNVSEQTSVFAQKDKKPLPLPFCCLRYRPSKPYFLVLLKWSVVQYCLVRPAISIAGIVTEYYEVYCSSSLSYKYAYVYLTSVDFVSISVALYGLIVLYALVRKDLQGKRPLAKFATIKLGIFLIFYQGFIFDLLADHGALHATQYWTTTNISDGLNALCTSLEMVLIAALQLWAFNPWREYTMDKLDHTESKTNADGKTNIFRSILHALNFSDILVELWREIVFLFDRMRGKEYTRRDARLDFVQAFGAEDDEFGVKTKPVSGMEIKEETSTSEEHNGRPVSLVAPNDHVGQQAGAATPFRNPFAQQQQQQQPQYAYNGSSDPYAYDNHASPYGTGRSDQPLLRAGLPPSGAAPASGTYANGAYGQNIGGYQRQDHGGQRQERPGSWEPQAY